MKLVPALLIVLSILAPRSADAQKRLVLIDQDASGPATTNEMSMMVLLQSPQADVLGITVVTGDAWRDEGVQHTLRMLELVGRSDVPVVPGAVFPLVRTQEETDLASPLMGKASWLGAWGRVTTGLAPAGSVVPGGPAHGPWRFRRCLKGRRKRKPLAEDAAHFLIRQVRAHPGQVTIYAAGPLTNIALALAIDPGFAELTRGIVIMGSSLNPQTDAPEFAASPRHEFNFWFDPEAAHIVLRARWPRIDVTTVDVSIKAMFTQEMFDAISRSSSPGGAVHRQICERALFPMGRARRLRLAGSEHHHEGPGCLHGRGSQPRAQLWGYAHVGRDAQAGRRAARARAGRSRSVKVHEDVRGSDVGALPDAGTGRTLTPARQEGCGSE